MSGGGRCINSQDFLDSFGPPLSLFIASCLYSSSSWGSSHRNQQVHKNRQVLQRVENAYAREFSSAAVLLTRNPVGILIKFITSDSAWILSFLKLLIHLLSISPFSIFFLVVVEY
jgi:hypothetical protein